ncbi:MAG: sigma-70 family RNA polymerase sigma factor, partial [Clostridia bacterium]|nr:sigma-70 family RNA polymerase sigma factor [Clostridia bacterium]
MKRKKSDYALNKEAPDAIVYQDAYDNIEPLTSEQFNSEEEFLKWKRWSDENYHEQEKKNNIAEKHTVSLFDVPEAKVAEPSHEAQIAEAEAEAERLEEVKRILHEVQDVISEKQFRRLWMWRVDGLSEYEIAAREGITQQA